MSTSNAATLGQSVSPAPDLLELAAEGLVTVLPGAAKTLTSTDNPGGFGSGRAIDVFGPPILQVWRQAMSQRTPQEQLEAIARLGRLSRGEGRQQVIQALARYEEQIPAEDRALAVEYLSSIPAAVRRCPVGDLGTRVAARPTGLATRTEQSL
ncbi:MAG TPA: hypothetical protein VFA18_13820, partial [Gemmataceae bacterium]|nr:hypothetical protein [Gemmataceae bacterium]